MKKTLKTILFLIVCISIAHNGRADENAEAGKWSIETLQSNVPTVQWLDKTSPIRSLLYSGQPIDGKPTEVFAFYASPKTLSKDHPGTSFPGIVLIHGGGGTAFSDWVQLWAERGYAAIAMDLAGHRPPAPEYDAFGKKVADISYKRERRTRLDKGGPNQSRADKFGSIGGSVDDDWPYHAVANVIAAHTLLRRFDEVDEDRTAVTGISWGGYTTCLVASLDNRFKAAVPVYGCGFLHEGESVQKPAIDDLDDRGQDWVTAYDPSSHLAKCTVPMFWVNGTHDKHYVLDSYAKSYDLVDAPQTFRIEPHMRHSHSAGWQPEEIGIYVDSILKRGIPLPKVSSMDVFEDGTVSVKYESRRDIVSARLHFTTEVGLRTKRKWQSIDAEVTKDRAIARGLPEDANTYVMTLTDAGGAMVSTKVGFSQ